MKNSEIVKIDKLINQFESLDEKNNLEKAIDLLNQALEIQKDDEFDNHWILTQKARLLSEMKQNNEALKTINEALKLAPQCPLSNYHKALIEADLGNSYSSIKILKYLLSEDINQLSYDVCGEGIKWTKSLLNDIRFDIAIELIKIGEKKSALKYIDDHLVNRRRGQSSMYTKKEIIKEKNDIIESMRKII